MKILLVLLLGILPMAAQIKDDPPVNPEEFLKTIKKIVESNKEGQRSEFQKAIKDFTEAAASPGAAVNFYEEAIQNNDYTGKNKGATEFSGWKAKEGPMLGNKSFQRWIQLHLTYLALFVRKSSGEKIKALEPEIQKYMEEVDATLDALDKEPPEMKKILEGYRDKSISLVLDKSPFVKWYQLDEFLTNSKTWEMNPSNVDGIFEKNILTPYREEKNPRLLEIWEQRLQFLQKESLQNASTAKTERFENIDLPKRLWSRAGDFALLGMNNRALNERLSVLTKYQTHPNFDKWAQELMGQLQSSPAPEKP